MRSGPERVRQSYRHEAFLWKGQTDFVDGLLPFLEDGVDGGEAVLVAAVPEHEEWLLDGLGAKASEVQFVDITQLGRNPARIMPALHQFLHDWSGHGRPARVIGEPLWEGRRPEEILESQLHEALMSLAVDPEMPFWVLCPYDTQNLDADILAEASRSHPALATATSYEGSRSYRGPDHAQAMFASDLPPMDGPSTVMTVTAPSVTAAAEALTLQAALGNLGSDQVVSLTRALRQLAADGLTRGAGQLTVRIWDRPDVLVCEVFDTTVIRDLFVGRRPPPPSGDDGVWLANQVCDLVQVRSSERGTVIRMHMRKGR
nr:sensor histidine kinase [uncultured Friedmanniella sp.]